MRILVGKERFWFMAREMMMRKGFVKMWRLGSLEFGEQSRWSRAPQNRGMWAFPYPFFEKDFAYHKYQDLMPKRLQDTSWEVQREWINTVGKKVLPVREFWYRGDVYSHFTTSGYIGNLAEWAVLDMKKVAGFIMSTGADRIMLPETGRLSPFRTTVDHMEVFIAPRMGEIRSSLDGASRRPLR